MSNILFLKYKNLPDFPFDDWRENINSFRALNAFWSEVFEAEVRDVAEFVHALEPHRQKDEGRVFASHSRDNLRGLVINHVSLANASKQSGFFVGSRFDEYCNLIPDSVTLEIGTDLSEDRVQVVRFLIRQQLNGELRNLRMHNDELDAVILAHPRLFPSMIKSVKILMKK